MFNEEESKKKNIIVMAVILIAAILIALTGMNRQPSRLENYSEDYLYRRFDGFPEDIKIVAIDDETLEALGPYNDWDRSYFADLINVLYADPEHSPEIIAFDVIFSGTNGSSEDAELVEAASKVPKIVMASLFEADNMIRTEEGTFYTEAYITEEHKPYDELLAVTDHAFTNVSSDSDGIVRHIYTKIPPDYTFFSYKIASMISDVSDHKLREEVIYSGKSGEVEAVSMARVLDGTVPAAYFDGSIVLVGAYTGGMMDSYKVPCDYSNEMYGVEMHANFITAFLHGRFVRQIPKPVIFLILFATAAAFGYLVSKGSVKRSTMLLLLFEAGYIGISFLLFYVFSIKLPLVSVFGGIGIVFILSLFYRYIELLRRRALETQNMLFSMAEAFAEAIEGRTPYNANHTKNVARRCVEMLDYINELHKEDKTEMHFSVADKKQLYLAAMLHDVGKMDVPTEIMDKPTKLGSREEKLKDRLSIIILKLENDILTGRKEKESAEKEIGKIKAFLENIGAFNCGRPLKDEEWAMIGEMEDGFYEEACGKKIPYLTGEEKDDLHIKAGTLSDNERTVMQSHVVFTDKILSHMIFGDMYKDVRRMAADHHELLNGKGYPRQLKAEDLDVMTRILTIMDIYDSLIADDRPYKKPKPVDVAFKILDEEAEAGKVDASLLEYAKDLYLRGSGN